MSLTLAITPSGHLRVEDVLESQPALSDTTAAALRRTFGQSTSEGLLLLATNELDQELPAEFVFWKGISREFFHRLRHLGEATLDQWGSLDEPGEEELTRLVAEAPPMRGLEYLTTNSLGRLWRELRELVVARAKEHPKGPAAWLQSVSPLWH